MSTVSLCHLTAGYAGRAITPEINAELRCGQLACLLGPNGAGKSTLLKTLSGFIRPVAGNIIIDEQKLTDMPPTAKARTMSVVLTERPATINMSVSELVAMGRSPYTSFFGGLKEQDWAVVNHAIDLVGISALASRNITTLSDGERQKAFIAKALAQQTPIIYLDEPTAFLDYPSKVEVMRLLQTIAHDEQKVVFMSTHDVELALQLSDKIWMLDRNHGLHIGIPEDLALQGNLAQYFQNEGLRFNAESCVFEIINQPCGQALLTGYGLKAAMVRKALMRKGYQLVSDPKASIKIEVESSAIYFGGKSYDKIEELLESLK